MWVKRNAGGHWLHNEHQAFSKDDYAEIWFTDPKMNDEGWCFNVRIGQSWFCGGRLGSAEAAKRAASETVHNVLNIRMLA